MGTSGNRRQAFGKIHLEAGMGTATAGFLPMKPGGAIGAAGAICTERSLLRNGEGERRRGGFRHPPLRQASSRASRRRRRRLPRTSALDARVKPVHDEIESAALNPRLIFWLAENVLHSTSK